MRRAACCLLTPWSNPPLTPALTNSQATVTCQPYKQTYTQSKQTCKDRIQSKWIWFYLAPSRAAPHAADVFSWTLNNVTWLNEGVPAVTHKRRPSCDWSHAPPPLAACVQVEGGWTEATLWGGRKVRQRLGGGAEGHTQISKEKQKCVCWEGGGGSSMACWERMAVSPLESRDVPFLMASPVRRQQRVWGKRRVTQLPPSDLWTPPPCH